MNDTLALLKDRLSKAEAKAARAEKAWESARSEVNDLQTALRVLTEISNDSGTAASPGTGANVAERQVAIFNLLQVGEAKATAPSEIFDAYKLIANEDISIDTFRTTIWRMKDMGFRHGPEYWIVKGDNGKYWKEPGDASTRMRHEARMKAVTRPTPPPSDDDLDDDTPF